MKTIWKLFLGLFIILIAIFMLASCVLPYRKDHNIVFLNEACIKPYQRYDYHTCDKLGVLIDGKKYVVPKNFKTNLASIPRLLWPFLAPQYSGFIAPAILHDFLYHCHSNMDRKFADEVLYSALLIEGVSKPTATKFYLAVRIFGRLHFEQNDICIPNILISNDDFELKISREDKLWTA